MVNKNKLQAFISRCLHYILKMWRPKKTTNAQLKQVTGQSDINLEISKRKFGKLGHILRKSYDEIPSTALTLTIERREDLIPTGTGP
jgi:hypothetical protein